MVSRIFKRLRLPQDHKMKYVEKLVRLHLRPISLTKKEITDSAIRRLLVDAGDELEDLMLLCEADITSKSHERRSRYANNYRMVRENLAQVEEKDKLRNWQPPVDGQQIMDTFGIGPGKEVGIIKQYIREAILDGIIPDDPESALQLMIEKGIALGLRPINAKS
jgi:poly(A) polymerase